MESAITLIGNVDDVDAGSQLEQFGREVGGIAVAGRSVIELAWVGLGVGDERRHRLRWKCGVDDQHLMILRNLRDGDEGFARVVVAIVADRRQHDERRDVSA